MLIIIFSTLLLTIALIATIFLFFACVADYQSQQHVDPPYIAIIMIPSWIIAAAGWYLESEGILPAVFSVPVAAILVLSVPIVYCGVRSFLLYRSYVEGWKSVRYSLPEAIQLVAKRPEVAGGEGSPMITGEQSGGFINIADRKSTKPTYGYTVYVRRAKGIPLLYSVDAMTGAVRAEK